MRNGECGMRNSEWRIAFGTPHSNGLLPSRVPSFSAREDPRPPVVEPSQIGDCSFSFSR